MGSSTVKAQQLANEANLTIARETNEMQKQLTQEANAFNREMTEYQNTWNLERRNEEWAYNDPSAQMERFMKAGINPLWAMSGADAGTAQQLTSADAKPAEVAQMQRAEVKPEYDPFVAQHIANINTAARNIMNGVQGFLGLDLQAQDVETRRAAQITRSGLDLASAAEKRAAAEGRNIENVWNLNTFDVRARAEGQKLSNMEKQYDLLDANTEEAKAKKLEIDEHKKLIGEQINAVIASVRQRDRELGIMQQNANTNARNAATNERNASTNEFNSQVANERLTLEMQKWNNDALLRYMEKFGRTVTAEGSMSVGLEGLGAKGTAGIKELNPATADQAVEAGIVLMQRAADDPTEANMVSASKAAKYIQMIQDEIQRRTVIPVDELFNSTDDSVLNPSGKWE